MISIPTISLRLRRSSAFKRAAAAAGVDVSEASCQSLPEQEYPTSASSSSSSCGTSCHRRSRATGGGGGALANNHDLVNHERAKRKRRPFIRSPFLDALARKHAEAMADRCTVEHSVTSIEQLQEKLGSNCVAENVQRGDSVLQMHDETMLHADNVSFKNILGDFEQFGMGVAAGRDGSLYMCQLFLRP